ncbi:MAG: hypothetical protein ACREM3_18525 [Candidatus Rokuibacteriota bacterium]
MLYAPHFRQYVIIPALAVFPESMRRPAAVELLLGTALVESRLTYLKQGRETPGDGRGVALGLYQMEPATHTDLWRNYLAYRPSLAAWISSEGIRPDQDLITDLTYATRMARVLYWRVPDALPAVDDVLGLARYWKAHWNTAQGAGRVEDFIPRYRAYA